MKQKFDIRAEVTGKIIAAIEAGTPPWRRPWTGGTTACAFPLRSNGQAYRGINILMLWLAAEERGYGAAHWFTYKQAQGNGAQVRKGEQASTVVKYGTVERENEQDIERAIPYLRAYRVFNADQIDGLPEEFTRPPEPPKYLGTKPDPTLEDFFAAFGVPVDTSQDPRAYYSPKTDRIHMPPINTFFAAADYFGVLAHEVAHATGHESRLDRFTKFQNKSDYAFEELVAEIAACLLGVELAFRPEPDQSAGYIEHWLRALNDDHGFIFKAASEAQKAVDLIHATVGKANVDTPGEVAA